MTFVSSGVSLNYLEDRRQDFVGSWRTAGKLLAPANGFLRFRWSIDLTRGIHRKEPGSFHEAVEAFGAMD
jgi:hypothetical protein